MESTESRWEKRGIFRYCASEDRFRMLLLPSTSRCVILAALYLFIGYGIYAVPRSAGVVFDTVLVLLAMWPLFQDLRAAWPVTIYRTGKIKFLIRTKYLQRIDKARVYSLAYGKCPEIGLISREIRSRARRLRLIDGAQDGPEYHFVGDELANWLQVRHQKGSYAMRALASKRSSPKP